MMMTGKALKEHVLATMLAICALLVLLSVTLTAQPLRELLGQALDAGDTDAAIELLQDAIQDDPSYHINYYLLTR